MYRRLLDFLRCPDCGERLEITVLKNSSDGEISDGVLHCRSTHGFPVVRGIPRLLSDSLERHWIELEPLISDPTPEALTPFVNQSRSRAKVDHDRRTQGNFSQEWKQHEVGDRTWSMDLDSRVEAFFLHPLHIPRQQLPGKLVLDAGCGNGSQSVSYTEFGCEVVAVDISTGVEHGQQFRNRFARGEPDKIHFVQADLERPPLAPRIFDVIHSTGVLHHTPDTRRTFDRLAPLLRPGGYCYVWLYKYEPYVTPLVNSVRAFTTPIPSSVFRYVALLLAPAFQGFCAVTNALGVRKYSSLSRREAAVALMDIFGAPYAHYHSFDEVAQWYRAQGLTDSWPCNEGRRGFGICGRLPQEAPLAVAGTASSDQRRQAGRLVG